MPQQTESSAEAHRRGPSATWRTNSQYSTVQPAPSPTRPPLCLTQPRPRRPHVDTQGCRR
ncbi:uncharacterized protein LACBIDRAFT_308691 [Laccaria bicolor S238N-H82]|uniref:Predicted protein n=1 Tax=Laccaria bicolor (strain S238N-H82 / ATCC MYA-4686) TaxID=486041 RepID=B0CWY6_LACBS|nr:uncharacterized protein LACBIDRAFT_308691 [Laccaria bicolor S238N-H82]EDR13150.1 predicted protein [Laccaria bicolor S238N-H82]|eukprot:XP_001875648.1 predicted protein [Laccaria bicolor S238N-H82]